MPGIAGIICKSLGGEEREKDVRAMLDSMRHSNRTKSGVYTNVELGVSVGWICHEGSFTDCMPLVNRERNVVIIFSGENFLDRGTRAEIRGAKRLIDECDARYLLELYEQFGDKFLSRLNGWFSGVIVDLRAKNVTVFNDRYGMGRTFVYQAGSEFLFASEAKALLRVRPGLRKLNRGALASYLRYSCIPDERTLFDGISLLPHGSSWKFQNGSAAARKRYFEFGEWERLEPVPPEEFYERFAHCVSNVFPAYASASSKVAISLTAGLDTRLLLASLGEKFRALQCYTFDGPLGKLFDTRTARKLAGIYGQPFESIRVDQRFFDRLPEYARKAVYISDGTYDAFGAHDVFFNEIARELAPVRLTGKFGSEIVRVKNLIPSNGYADGFLQPEFEECVKKLQAYQEVRRERHVLTGMVTGEIPSYEYPRVAVEQSQLVLRSPYMDNELVKLMFQAPVGIRAKGDHQERYIREKGPEFTKYITNLGRFASIGPFGSGSRALTRAYYWALWALFKVEYIYLYATPHWLTWIDRHLSVLNLERVFSGRQKWEGYRVWMNTKFPDFIRDTLFSANARYPEFFERAEVEKMVTRHLNGTHNFLMEINRVLSVELICSSLL